MDVVLDTIGGDVLKRSYGVVRRGGWLVALHEHPSQAEAAARGINATYFIVTPSRDDLTQIAGLVDAGRLKAIVSKVMPLAEARAAYEQGVAGHNRGKTVLQVV